MFTTTGVAKVLDNPEETKWNGGSFFNLTGRMKSLYKKGGEEYYNISIYVPEEHLLKAREKLIKDRPLFVRIAELRGNLTKSRNAFMQLHTRWQWVTPLNLNTGFETHNE